jgi:hypothetical protein
MPSFILKKDAQNSHPAVTNLGMEIPGHQS